MRTWSGWLILATVLAVPGCDGKGTGLPYEEDAYPPGWGDVLADAPSEGSCMSGNVWAEPDFDWRMTTGVEVSVSIFGPDGGAWPDVMVQVYDDASDLPGLQTLLAKGMTDADGRWTGSVWTPLTQDAVNIVVNIVGAKNWARLPVADGVVVAEFGRE
jgi:hypothetical protein